MYILLYVHIFEDINILKYAYWGQCALNISDATRPLEPFLTSVPISQLTMLLLTSTNLRQNLHSHFRDVLTVFSFPVSQLAPICIVSMPHCSSLISIYLTLTLLHLVIALDPSKPIAFNASIHVLP